MTGTHVRFPTISWGMKMLLLYDAYRIRTPQASGFNLISPTICQTLPGLRGGAVFMELLGFFHTLS